MKDLTLDALQKTVDDWIQTIGVRYFDETTNTLLLTEEVGELARLIARVYGEQSFKTEQSEDVTKNAIGDEIADILFVLTCLANQMGYNLNDLMAANLDKKTSRDKNRHKTNKKLRP